MHYTYLHLSLSTVKTKDNREILKQVDYSQKMPLSHYCLMEKGVASSPTWIPNSAILFWDHFIKCDPDLCRELKKVIRNDPNL